jgi:hypothetical protein
MRNIIYCAQYWHGCDSKQEILEKSYKEVAGLGYNNSYLIIFKGVSGVTSIL